MCAAHLFGGLKIGPQLLARGASSKKGRGERTSLLKKRGWYRVFNKDFKSLRGRLRGSIKGIEEGAKGLASGGKRRTSGSHDPKSLTASQAARHDRPNSSGSQLLCFWLHKHVKCPKLRRSAG